MKIQDDDTLQDNDAIQVVMTKESAVMLMNTFRHLEITKGPIDVQEEDQLPTYFLMPSREALERAFKRGKP